MHIPDGFLDTKTIVATTTLSAVGFSIALRNLKNRIIPRQVPMMGLAAAFVFVAQMLNFPIIGGTSGHLIGSVLIAVLLGPSAAVIVITLVLLVQCFFFADGGLLALGANVFNMAIVGSLFGYSIYRTIYKFSPTEKGKYLAIGFASWCSTVLASIFCAGELACAGSVNWKMAFPAMTNIHMLIGIGEGMITTLVIATIQRTRAELLSLDAHKIKASRYKEFLVYGVVIVIGLILFVLPFISKLPDGLEKVAAMLGFEYKTLVEPIVPSPIIDYQFPGIGSPVLATWIAGVVGAVVVFVLASIFSHFLAVKSEKQAH